MCTDLNDVENAERFYRLVVDNAPVQALDALGKVARAGLLRAGAASSLEARLAALQAVITALGHEVKPGLAKAQGDVDFILKTANSVFGIRPLKP